MMLLPVCRVRVSLTERLTVESGSDWSTTDIPSPSSSNVRFPWGKKTNKKKNT